MTKRIALVTGGIGGLGTEICRYLVKSGHTVVAADLSSRPERLTEFRQETADVADDIFFEPFNVADFDSCAALAKKVEADRGAVDILVNAAGIT
ncbi:MAG: SDR family NAD(P)-dependent oxidoreductase, partial [Gammaproteobacteria bacterium]